jgi:uncharacterized membrane protein YkoI
MTKRVRNLALAVTAVGALAGGGAAIAGAAGDGGPENDPKPAPSDGARATRAALAHTGGGHANAVELDGENGATYEVEVTKPDGKTVDVRVDDAFRVVVVESDSGG